MLASRRTRKGRPTAESAWQVSYKCQRETWRFSFMPSLPWSLRVRSASQVSAEAMTKQTMNCWQWGEGWVSWGRCWLLPVAFSFMPGNNFHEDPFHNFSRNSSEADSSVISQIFFFALFVGGCNICPFPVSWDFPWTPWHVKYVKVWLWRRWPTLLAACTCGPQHPWAPLPSLGTFLRVSWEV